MKLRTILMGAVAAMAIAPVAHAERGSDGEVKIIYWQAPSILNPYLSGGTKDIESASLVVEPLARFDQAGRWFPGSSTRSRPSKTAVSPRPDLDHLEAEGIMWSDGTPVTSADVKFTGRILHGTPTAAARRAPSSTASKASTPDDLTIVVNFEGPTPFPTPPSSAREPGHPGPSSPTASAPRRRNAPRPTSARSAPAPSSSRLPPNDVITIRQPELPQPRPSRLRHVTFKGGGDAVRPHAALPWTGEFDYAWNLQLDPQILRTWKRQGYARRDGFGTWSSVSPEPDQPRDRPGRRAPPPGRSAPVPRTNPVIGAGCPWPSTARCWSKIGYGQAAADLQRASGT
jgi:peptide/nickel transport system substrate-binding protein